METTEVHMATPSQTFANRVCAADPVLPNEDRNQFDALLERYQSELAPKTAHQEFLVSLMAGARWKLERLARIEVAMFAALENPREAFTNKDTAAGFARLDRYRASLERTYHRCARELCATSKLQNEANSTQTAEKKFEKLLEMSLKRSLNGPPPGFFDSLKQHPADHNAGS
jgi:hypothetical protein